ncbi:MAG: hypothetical protein J0L70_11340 [Leptolyngbya sp. UWPOB_LEPTO1]|uniref:hypothetical protein n=1 Tax=Leptolyngbya sp. UWPOB_LEPTO1 TaxID=2815653 RepID=UPI001AC0EB7D|nr:hypothetical protein [Leptolyngbya sp. UWPOB_LEPTO1]MBN8561110.1 hypothetical protein [Leptolyngbya sp. UWPOB_LEPTO1]
MMSILKSLTLLSILTASLPAIAQTKQVLDQSCRQGTCWESSLISKKLVHQNQLGGELSQLYRIEVETKLTARETTTKRATQWVYCSMSEPFVAFSQPSDDLIYLHYLNPGSEIYGYNAGSSRTYWAICHNTWSAETFGSSENLARKARQLGYSLTLQSVQREIPKQLFQP